jgi:hypothetical protein
MILVCDQQGLLGYSLLARHRPVPEDSNQMLDQGENVGAIVCDLPISAEIQYGDIGTIPANIDRNPQFGSSTVCKVDCVHIFPLLHSNVRAGWPRRSTARVYVWIWCGAPVR